MIVLQSGNRRHTIDFPDGAEVEILKTDRLPVVAHLPASIDEALNCSAGGDGAGLPSLSIGTDGRVAFVVTETVTPEVLEVALPMILDRLYQANEVLKPNAVTIVVGEWLKQSPQAKRFKKLFKSVSASGCRVIIHDSILQTMVDLGVTSKGTPVRVNSEFANAGLKIVLDRIKPSPLFGFAESPLRLARSCMAIESIESLEALIPSSAAENCRLDRHPMFEEIQEMIRMVGIDGSLAEISDPMGETIGIMAGKPPVIIRQAAAIYRQHYLISVETPFDIAVVGFGPNRAGSFVASVQTGLLAAAQVLKEGGHLMIIGDDTRGVGTDIYFDYICHCLSPAALIEGFIRSRNRVGAGGFGKTGRHEATVDVGLEKIFGVEVIHRCQFRAADPSTVLVEWADEYEGRPRIAVIPEGYGTFYYPD